MVAACDFCSERAAVLYCRADSAKLCVSCDQHVHSANALSKKHVRSQICDNCAAAPAAVRCATDNLVLCQDCDFDAHGGCPASSAHDRCPAADGFSGCPSALELASAWGLDIIEEERKKSEAEAYQWGCRGLLEELMVPNGSSVIYSNRKGDFVKEAVPTCGKQKQLIVKQLSELLADGVEELRLQTPISGGAWREEGLFEEQQKQSGGREFTSLLMMETPANIPIPKEEGNMLWNTNSTIDRHAQIWDFNLGQLTDHVESGAPELDFGGSDMDYVVKNYGELLKEASGTRRGLVDFPGVICSFAHEEEMIPFNGLLNNPTASQGPATSESNNAPASCSGFNTRPKNSYGCSKDIQFTDESILIKSESVASQADLELLAKHRGNAMQRYKEKKKNRRYEKQIRYESRKARADTRKRVKGRFVKAIDTREG